MSYQLTDLKKLELLWFVFKNWLTMWTKQLAEFGLWKGSELLYSRYVEYTIVEYYLWWEFELSRVVISWYIPHSNLSHIESAGQNMLLLGATIGERLLLPGTTFCKRLLLLSITCYHRKNVLIETRRSTYLAYFLAHTNWPLQNL